MVGARGALLCASLIVGCQPTIEEGDPGAADTGDDGGSAEGQGSAGGGDGSGDGSSGGGPAGGPWDHGWFVPPEPQTPGDPDAGYHQLVHNGYISCGIPFSIWWAAQAVLGEFANGEPLPDRSGDNAGVPYNWTVHDQSATGRKIVSQNCLQCHAGRFDGELVIGLGTADTDFTTSLSDMVALVPSPDLPGGDLAELTKFIDRLKALGPWTAMRTVGTNPAEAIAVTLVAHRDRHTLQWSDELLEPLPNIIVPSDPPPWWRAHKKHALFYNAMARGDHRGTMLLATSLCTDSVEEAEAVVSYFHDIHAFIRSIRAPEYPFPIDAELAARGEPVFNANCAGCHGTYAASEQDDTYPNLLFPLQVIGTDPVVAEGGTTHAPYMVDWYNDSFYGGITRLEPDDPFPGYIAPPLDGVWATGPFLHNGSVPNLALVLDSTRRPTYWKRIDYDSSNFDQRSLGWPYVELPYGHAGAGPDETKYIYDTTQFAHSNAGHIFGDHLTDDERATVLEYLKTL